MFPTLWGWGPTPSVIRPILYLFKKKKITGHFLRHRRLDNAGDVILRVPRYAWLCAIRSRVAYQFFEVERSWSLVSVNFSCGRSPPSNQVVGWSSSLLSYLLLCTLILCSWSLTMAVDMNSYEIRVKCARIAEQLERFEDMAEVNF